MKNLHFATILNQTFFLGKSREVRGSHSSEAGEGWVQGGPPLGPPQGQREGRGWLLRRDEG